ncbi:MAG: hypothetical protein H7A40_07490 [Chlamydiales bacterium]|nr:hypothetical protein [Chlamydiales bacterium]
MIGNFISAYRPSNLEAKWKVCGDAKAPEKTRIIAAANLCAKAVLGIMIPLVLSSLAASCLRLSFIQVASNVVSLVAIHDILMIVDGVFQDETSIGGQANHLWSAGCNKLKDLWNGTNNADLNFQKDNLRAYTKNTLVVKHIVNLF